MNNKSIKPETPNEKKRRLDKYTARRYDQRKATDNLLDDMKVEKANREVWDFDEMWGRA